MNYLLLGGMIAVVFLIMFLYGEKRFDDGWKSAIKDLVEYKEGADVEN